jgi:hypothetical protein
MRALKILTIAMAVLIVFGTLALTILIARRLSGTSQKAPFAVELSEPAGTRIVGLTAVQDQLALHFEGGGPDRVLLIDPRSGATSGRMILRTGNEEGAR